MLSYIPWEQTIFSAPRIFMTLFLTFPVIHVCLPGQKTGQCGEIKIIRTGISWHAFISTTLLKRMRTHRQNYRFADEIHDFARLPHIAVKFAVCGEPESH